MGKNLIIMILFVLASIALIIFLIRKNHKDRKSLFKKMPGDLPDPPIVKSEFDSAEK